MPRDKPNDELTVPQASELSKRSQNGIRKLIYDKCILARRPGREYLVDRNSLLQYLSSPRVRGPRKK